MKRSPTLEGFKTIFGDASIGLAEIVWRWSVGLAGVALLILGGVEYLRTLPVSANDMFLLRTRQPALIARALQQIFHGSALRLVESAIVLGLAYALAWTVIASVGRAITLQALLQGFEERFDKPKSKKSWRLGTLLRLNVFRLAVTFAAALGFFGAILLARFASSSKDPSPGSAMLVFLTVLMLVALAWLALNWFLSLAAVFVVTRNEGIRGAIIATARLCQKETGALLAVAFWFGLAHLVAYFIATSAVAFPLAFISILPGSVVLGGMLMVSLLYFAIVDLLYIGRLGAYLAIAQGPDFLTMAAPQVDPERRPPTPLALAPETRVDPEELILSDHLSELPAPT
jgi:hypothetical protein